PVSTITNASSAVMVSTTKFNQFRFIDQPPASWRRCHRAESTPLLIQRGTGRNIVPPVAAEGIMARSICLLRCKGEAHPSTGFGFGAARRGGWLGRGGLGRCGFAGRLPRRSGGGSGRRCRRGGG